MQLHTNRRDLYRFAAGIAAIAAIVGSAVAQQGPLPMAKIAEIAMLKRHAPGADNQLTLGADKGYDAAEFVAILRQMCVTPHVAAEINRSSIDGRTTRHESYKVSQRKRKLVEEAFGWAKTIAGWPR